MSEDAPHILVVDDDERLRGLLRRFLADQGFVVSVAADANEARRHLDGMAFDLLVIDVMMPGEDGLSLTRHVHDTLGVPVLMLSARGETDDRIVGLQSGADDYLTKPFEPLELVLRIKSILRRAAAETTDQTAAESGPRISVITMGACSFDLDRLELLRDGAPVHLTGTESALLLALAERAGTSVSREDLADLTGADGNPRTIDVQVTRLRKKIEADPRLPRHLQTIRGKGYLLRPGP